MPCITASWSREGRTIIGGSQGNDSTQLSHPYGLYIDSNNILFIADSGNNRVIKLEKDALNGTIIAGFEPGQLKSPSGITIDKEGTLFILDGDLSSLGRVTYWNKESKIGKTLFYSDAHLNGFVLDTKEEFFYFAQTMKDRAVRYNKDGTSERVVAGGHSAGSALYQFRSPWDIAIDNNENLYIADSDNNRVVKWPLNATEGILIAGGNGWGNKTNQLASPRSILIDGINQILYVADTYNDRIIRLSISNGNIQIIAGGYGRGNALNQLFNPNGLAFDTYGNLYVSDRENHRIQMFSIDNNSCNLAAFISYKSSIIYLFLLLTILNIILFK